MVGTVEDISGCCAMFRELREIYASTLAAVELFMEAAVSADNTLYWRDGGETERGDVGRTGGSVAARHTRHLAARPRRAKWRAAASDTMPENGTKTDRVSKRIKLERIETQCCHRKRLWSVLAVFCPNASFGVDGLGLRGPSLSALT